MKDLLFIRHGATEGNLQRRYIGRTDEPLCDAGVVQVLALRESVPPVDRLFVSPMLRTRQTAELLFPHVPARLLHELREMDFGDFEGRNADELGDDPAYRAWVDAGCTAPVPGGEDVTAFKRRCTAAFIDAMGTVPEGGCAAFVTHGGCIMAVLEALADPPRNFYEWHIGNGQALRCVYEERTIRLQA